MTTIGRTILTLALTALLTGCVGTRIEYFTDTAYPSREITAPVGWLTAEPEQAHVEVARITVRSSNYSMETLRQTMLDRARALGADAIVPDVPMVVRSQTGSPYFSPYFEPGLAGPSRSVVSTVWIRMVHALQLQPLHPDPRHDRPAPGGACPVRHRHPL